MVNNDALVSVIIACYNGEKFIDQCMDMLINQTYSNIEIIVCDDSSTDNSLGLLKQWAIKDSRVKILHNDKNLYAAATRNRCFEIAKGDYFCIQDIDDKSPQNRIERLVDEMQKTKADFISSAMRCFNADNQMTKKVIKHKNKPTKWDFLWGISFCHPATIFTRQCIQAVNGYRVSDETRRCQDYDMFMRLYACGYKGMNISEPLYYYRLDDNTKKRGANYSATMCEFRVRKYGFKILRLPVAISYIFSLKPLFAFVIKWLDTKVLQ